MYPLAIEVYDHNLSIPLKYKGTKLVYQTSLPTEDELNNLPHIELTSETTWDTGNVVLGVGDVATNTNMISGYMIDGNKLFVIKA